MRTVLRSAAGCAAQPPRRNPALAENKSPPRRFRRLTCVPSTGCSACSTRQRPLTQAVCSRFADPRPTPYPVIPGPTPCILPGEWLYRFSAGFSPVFATPQRPRPLTSGLRSLPLPLPVLYTRSGLVGFRRPLTGWGNRCKPHLLQHLRRAGRAKSARGRKLPLQTDCLVSARDAHGNALPSLFVS